MNTQLCRLIYKNMDLHLSADRANLALTSSRIPKPSERLLMGEAGSTTTSTMQGLIGGPAETIGPNEGSAYPHANHMNILYVDLHVNKLSRGTMRSNYLFYQPLFGITD